VDALGVRDDLFVGVARDLRDGPPFGNLPGDVQRGLVPGRIGLRLFDTLPDLTQQGLALLSLFHVRAEPELVLDPFVVAALLPADLAG